MLTVMIQVIFSRLFFKRLIITIAIIGISNIAFSQASTQNYLRTRTPRKPINNNTTLDQLTGIKDSVETTIQYFDGVGRLLQTVQQQASPAGYDFIQPVAYDEFEREVNKYLPYSVNTAAPGAFRINALSGNTSSVSDTYSTSEQYLRYQQTGQYFVNTTYPNATTIYEPAPLERVMEQGAPGAGWQPYSASISTSGHTNKIVYTSNNITPLTDTANTMLVALYTAPINTDLTHTLTMNGNYAAGQLTVTVSRDENWVSGRAGTTEEYNDKDGRVVLKRTFNYIPGTSPVFQILSTYYVYDDYGNLAFVLSPLANADNALPVQTMLDNLCYQYRYDTRNRLTEKRIPGKGWEYLIYNKIDQVVASQDAMQRAGNNWIFTKYDALGRMVITGIWNNGNTAIPRIDLQTVLNGITTSLWEKPSTTGNTYSNVAWPTTAVTATLTINYYDNYANISGKPSVYSAPAGSSIMTTGELVASKVAVLNNPADMLWVVNYYDNLGRGIKSYQQHYLGSIANSNNYDDISTTYNFTNAPTTITRKHWNTASTTIPQVTIANTYIYDHAGRKLKAWEQITNGNSTPGIKTLLSKIDYNEIGQQYAKHLHSTDSLTFMQDISYTYNERGWLATSSAPLFAMQLYYNTGTNKGWNGNIMYQWSGVPGNLANHYSYKYDKLNRILSGTSTGMFNETGITYDLNGNIATLKRTNGSSTVTDDLAYTYTSSTNPTNQLQSITDATTSDVGLKHGTFAYTYDGNGNQLTDPAKGPTGITLSYNLLNLPQTVTGSKAITYTYDAAGQKLRRVSTTATGGTGKTDYISGIQYDDNNSGTETLSFIQTEEGKAVPATGGSYNYTYYLGDQLGNTRVTFDTQSGSAGLLQTDNYYPFGMEQTVGTIVSTKNEYLYNKKELQEELGEYDYGARFYDPVIGRWNTIDPLAGNHKNLTPYNYVMNNPILYVDEFGLDTGKVKPTPQPVRQLKKVQITATRTKKKSNDAPMDPVGTNLFHHVYKPAPWNHDDCHCPVLDQAIIWAIIISTDGLGDFLEGAAADESLESLTTEELNAKITDEQRNLLRKWFADIKSGANVDEVPPEGLTKQTIKVYRQIAKNAVEAGKDTRLGVQAERLKIIDKALPKIK